ncbi:hypothetical protein [Williamsia serinedens]|uniref:WXG100 family type VII secretion target n=1 Tax=Williamsia serinedens TaxID=391736 RepID=A0ABT1H4M2_9NOCA|nr:hypothetical protein [Williamsia serinedens]MCP2160792.1 hypothetical protein [Williamsia serinedens]
MVAFGEILKFDPSQIQEIFGACSGQQQTCSAIEGHLKNLSDLHTWQGDASQAAKDGAGKTRKDLDAHGNEVWKVAAAARDCFNEAVELKASAQRVQADADAKGCVIDPRTGTVTPPAMQGWADVDKAAYYAEVDALQARVNDVIAAAERFDDDLAAAINAADGSIPLTPKGEGANVNLADRRANQVAAYRKTYGKDPATANDWRMAEALDPHTYDPKYQGALSNVSVARIEPKPGAGVVRTNLYIPSKQVQNVSGNPLDWVAKQQFPNNLGDDRGPDVNASAEHSRVSVYVDYERGMVVARQNPTVVKGPPADLGTDHSPRAGVPEVSALQSADGTVRIKYFGSDAFQPEVATAGKIGVAGDLTVRPSTTGSAAIDGTVTPYPAIESYNYKDDGTVHTLVQRGATNSELGPGLGLLRGPNTHIGTDLPDIGPTTHASPQMGYPGTQQTSADDPGIPLGSADHPPKVPVE